MSIDQAMTFDMQRWSWRTLAIDLLSEGMSNNNAIEINDLEMLEKIGSNNDFPPDGNYELTANIDAMNFTKTVPEFRGDFNGNNHTISNLQVPLMVSMTNGTIRNLTISNANIYNSTQCLSTLACFVKGNSKISYAQFKDSHIQSKNAKSYNAAGIVTSDLSGSSQIDNILVENCTIATYKPASWVGSMVGLMRGESTSKNNTADRCSIITNENNSDCGGLIGAMLGENLSSNDTVTNCNVSTAGINSHGGGVVGHAKGNSEIINVRVSDSRITVDGENSGAGIVLGSSTGTMINGHASISESSAINSIAIATHESSKAGIWVGSSSGNIQIYNNTYSNCTIESPTPRESTTTENLTTTEPAMIVDGAPFLQLGVLLAGATVTSIGLAGCFVYSLYNGYQEGKRGRSLAMHPFASFGKLLNNCCRSATGFQPLDTDHIEDYGILMNDIVSTGDNRGSLLGSIY